VRIRAVALVVLTLFGLAVAALVWRETRSGRDQGRRQLAIADVVSERLTRLGSVVGFAAAHDTHAWLGIPYARPPVGELRWRAPARVEPWTDTLDALEWPERCVQRAHPLGGVENAPLGAVVGSEDCLYLNVWAPRFEPKTVPTRRARLPVLVWIHGGGNTVGHAGDLYDGSRLAGREALVVVTVDYRLGPFGWFAHPALAGEGASAEDRSGNFGTLDLVAALGWVHENIEYFGGDPGRVTIFGESAGGTNVVSLMLSPLARGLFHGAIVQSGSTASTSLAAASHYRDDPMPGHPHSSREVVLDLLRREGALASRDEARQRADSMPPQDLAAWLRSRSPDEILAAYAEDGGRISLPRIFRDGFVLPEAPPLEVFTDARAFNAVPVILGSNRDEIKLFFSQDPEFVRRYLQIFVRLRDEERYQLLSRFHSDMWKVTGVDEPAAVLRASLGPKVFAYRFDWDEEPVVLGADLGVLLGAAHGMEIPFVFGHFRFGRGRLAQLIFDSDNLPGRVHVSDAMMSYWAQFAYAGDPDGGREGTLPRWLPWDDSTPEAGRFLVFDTPAGGGIRMSSQIESRQSVIERIDAEDGLAQSERCRIFYNLFRHGEGWSPEAYADMGRRGCREHPWQTFESE